MVVCPACAAKFVNSKGLPPGTSVRCPRCKQPFAIGADAVSAKPAARRPSPLDDWPKGFQPLSAPLPGPSASAWSDRRSNVQIAGGNDLLPGRRRHPGDRLAGGLDGRGDKRPALRRFVASAFGDGARRPAFYGSQCKSSADRHARTIGRPADVRGRPVAALGGRDAAAALGSYDRGSACRRAQYDQLGGALGRRRSQPPLSLDRREPLCLPGDLPDRFGRAADQRQRCEHL